MVTLLANVGLDRAWSFCPPCTTLSLLATLSSCAFTWSCLLALYLSCRVSAKPEKAPESGPPGIYPSIVILVLPLPQGLRKRELLKELLPVIGQNLRFQRLFTECQEQLDILRDK